MVQMQPQIGRHNRAVPLQVSVSYFHSVIHLLRIYFGETYNFKYLVTDASGLTESSIVWEISN